MKDGKSNGDMWFLERDVFMSASNERAGSEEIGLLDSPVISFNHHFVAANGKEAFEQKSNEVKGLLEDFAKPFAVKGAWRTDLEDEPSDAEWDVVVGWPSVEKHMDFAKQESFAKYRELMGFITGFEVRHYRRFS
ncbi:hypothetical protein VM1G_07255 [Cytospora mali]|uniref:ABM domain-containing protein n=1 Tax=Cytospora mali TaxID=578113 RepID=A0A194W4U7_CYTMA|nr:hypothetical protein VM1G_07255 [Valsa mali]